jgi:phosphoenolpyruvate-protein phosphotransferase
MKRGVPISPGVAVGRAYCLNDGVSAHTQAPLDDTAVAMEINRLEGACAAAVQELDNLIARVSSQVGEEEAAIFRAHRLLVRDPALLGKVKSAIRQRRLDARTALQEALNEYNTLFTQIQDEYLKERMADLHDIVRRISGHLTLQQAQQQFDRNEPVVIVADEILPSQALAFEKLNVVGILTEKGGTTGHAAILARALGLPTVSGLRGLMREIHTGDLVAVDGREGHVQLNPGPEVEAAYRKLQREYVDLRASLIENRDLDAVTLDGIPIQLCANVNGTADAAMAVRVGAEAVGLYRTEYLFLTHSSVPDEQEQFEAYRTIIEASPNRTVTIRTLDLGGDKQVPYLNDQREANPFMGWRSIRLSTAHPEFFQTQLRAILRAGCYGHVNLLFPMISTLEELQRLKRMLARTRVALQRAGVAQAEEVPVGVMLEVPAAALCVEALLDEVDFVSIGSNDLIQYVMAADRDNPKVAHLCEPFNPAVLRLLRHVLMACNARSTPVTLCGEMAGRPRCFLPLFGMGLRRFSMSPALIPPLKELIRRTTLPVAEEIAARVLKMKTFGEIRGYLTRKARRIWPDVALWDTSK